MKNTIIFVSVNVHGIMYRSMDKKVGVKQIAKAAGVSIGTVDRVLHKRGNVKRETKEKIMAIIKELKYKPNVLARSLSTKKITRIAIVIPDSSDKNPYWEKPVKGIKMAADELAGFNIEIIYKHFDASNENSFKEVLEHVCSKDCDGVVLNPVFKSVALHYISIFNNRNIPYVFIDVNIMGVSNLGYFGQDAEQSGIVAAHLLDMNTAEQPKVLIVKQSNKKIFSQHIESRIKGFYKYFEKRLERKNVIIDTIEIDLEKTGEPQLSLSGVLNKSSLFDAIFVPNTRAFKVADYLSENNITGITITGYDLVQGNIEHLQKGNITHLISQKPEEQAYKAIMALFDNLITKKDVVKTNYSPIDIIIKENLDYYIINKSALK